MSDFNPAVELETLANGGWLLTGGACPEAQESMAVGSRVVISLTGGSAEFVLTLGNEQWANRKYIRLVESGLIIERPQPHLVHIKCIFPQKTTIMGGQEQFVPRLGVWVKFFNPEIKNREKDKRQRQEQEKLHQAAAAHQLFLDDLGVVGKKLVDVIIHDDGRGAILTFEDGSGLHVNGNDFGIEGQPPRAVDSED